MQQIKRTDAGTVTAGKLKKKRRNPKLQSVSDVRLINTVEEKTIRGAQKEFGLGRGTLWEHYQDACSQHEFCVVSTPNRPISGDPRLVDDIYALTYQTMQALEAATKQLPEEGNEEALQNLGKTVIAILEGHTNKAEDLSRAHLQDKLLFPAHRTRILEVLAQNNHAILEIAELYMDQMTDRNFKSSPNLETADRDYSYRCNVGDNKKETKKIRAGTNYIHLHGRTGLTNAVIPRNFPRAENLLMMRLKDLERDHGSATLDDIRALKQEARDTYKMSAEEIELFFSRPRFHATRPVPANRCRQGPSDEQIANVLGIGLVEFQEIDKVLKAKLAAGMNSVRDASLDFIHRSTDAEPEDLDGCVLPTYDHEGEAETEPDLVMA